MLAKEEGPRGLRCQIDDLKRSTIENNGIIYKYSTI